MTAPLVSTCGASLPASVACRNSAALASSSNARSDATASSAVPAANSSLDASPSFVTHVPVPEDPVPTHLPHRRVPLSLNGEVVLSLPVSQSHHPCSSSAVTVPTAVDTVTPAGKRRGWSSESHCLPIRRRDEHSALTKQSIRPSASCHRRLIGTPCSNSSGFGVRSSHVAGLRSSALSRMSACISNNAAHGAGPVSHPADDPS